MIRGIILALFLLLITGCYVGPYYPYHRHVWYPAYYPVHSYYPSWHYRGRR